MLLQAAKYIGAGLATIGLAGAGVGIGTGANEKSMPFCSFVEGEYMNIKLRKFYYRDFVTAV